MADAKVTVEFVNGKRKTIILDGVTPAQVKSAIETAKAAGTMIPVGQSLIAPEHIVTVEKRN